MFNLAVSSLRLFVMVSCWRPLALFCLSSMGVESGGGGDASPAVEKSAGDVPPEIMIFQYLFS